MQPPNDDDEFVRRKVIVETGASSGSSRGAMGALIAIVVIALILVGYILLHLHK